MKKKKKHLEEYIKALETGKSELKFGDNKPKDSVFLWSLDDMSSYKRLPIPMGKVDAVIFSRDGSKLAVNSDDKIYVFDVRP